ncbi:MAG: DUF488 domain-containing protein [Planctomycetes bacterium]|jgi:uncharacterized protein (DUF488 family)|nr:DUF488 domain-containing protein [Planctomycetota bacterium]
MVELAGRPVTHLELTKWAFLLAHETPSHGGASFYDFLPYKYGPFSFALFHEADDLVRNGYLRDTKADGREAWARAAEVDARVGNMPGGLRADAARVVERFVSRTSEQLIDYVYDAFPWYTSNSSIRKLSKRPLAKCAVYTVGYEQWSVDQLLNTLMRRGIVRVIDVRRNPVARRYGFHKSTLTRLTSRIALEYVHFPELGIPSELRQDLQSDDDYASLFDEYTTSLLPRRQDAVAEVSHLVSDKPSVLLCMEADPAMCHRTRLAAVVSSQTGLPVQDIRGAECELTLS